MTDLALGKIALTPGEPAGIGPDLVVQLAQGSLLKNVVVFADKNVLIERAKQLGSTLECFDYHSDSYPIEWKPGYLIVASQPLKRSCIAGKLDVANVPAVIHALSQATQACMRQEFQALVTGPINKNIINQAGIPFRGHTEFLAEETGAPHVVMMLVADTLRVALVTTHLPLLDVPKHITKKRVKDTISVLNKSLIQEFGIATPQLVVCGLNPHAGEGGYLGREDIDIISPVIQEFLDQGMAIKGPFPADTVFTPAVLNQADVVLTMYHDQGLPVLKYLGFGHAVNVTLGLPIIRTSVDHGTALELAGTGKASSDSLRAAIEMANSMIAKKLSGAERRSVNLVVD